MGGLCSYEFSWIEGFFGTADIELSRSDTAFSFCVSNSNDAGYDVFTTSYDRLVLFLHIDLSAFWWLDQIFGWWALQAYEFH